jgi:glycerol kinase
MSNEETTSRFIITVDVGTTTIRSCIYDQECNLKFYNERRVGLFVYCYLDHNNLDYSNL